MTSIVALIPARANSKRIPGKALKPLGGRPLIDWTIIAAQRTGIFDEVLVCTDWQELAEVVGNWAGVGVAQRNVSHDAEPDIQWVQRALFETKHDAFAILRPTSPFRTAETIRRAWLEFLPQEDGANWQWDSLRAVEPARQHPAKMWRISDCALVPLLLQPTGTPWHSSPTQTLPKVYVQNASLEIAWTDTVRRTGTIAGDRVLAFETHGYEGFDINTLEDWILAEALIERGLAKLPEVT